MGVKDSRYRKTEIIFEKFVHKMLSVQNFELSTRLHHRKFTVHPVFRL